MTDTILFLTFAYIGGTLGIRLKLPAGALLGSMLFVGIFTMTDIVEFTNVSPVIRTAAQVALGAMIGLMFTKEILMLPLKQIFGLIILGLGSVLSAVFIALLFNWVGVFPFITGVIAVAPGGIAEMLTLADSLDVNTQTVVMMHIIRFVTIMLILKWLLNMIKSKGKSKHDTV